MTRSNRAPHQVVRQAAASIRFESLEPRQLFSVPTPSNALEIAPIGAISFGPNTTEIVAHDPATQKLFSLNGTQKRIEVTSLANPATPVKVDDIDLNVFNVGGLNSVAVKNGMVAVAVEAATAKTDPGEILFFSTNGNLLRRVTVGAQPDMVTFTPDGSKLLVANEGEINTGATINPEGSVSIINLSGGVATATVTTAGFTAFNSQYDRLKLQGVRLSAGATVAQDVEPEYITVAPDGLTARVTLQENNALAVLDLQTNQITAIQPLGLKDFSTGTPVVANYDIDAAVLPTIGTTPGGQTYKLGGFSGLFFEGVAANGNLKFVTHTDRGPNGEPTDILPAVPGNERPFALPTFRPRIVRLELNRTTGQITLTQEILLTRQDGTTPITGLPNLQAGNQGTPFTDEVPVDPFGQQLANDPFGADLEGIAVAADGSFWMGDEYRPAIYHFDATGKLIERYVPQGTAAAVGQPAGTFGKEVLPAVYGERRRANRGFEALALEGNKVYAFIQTTLDNPNTSTPNVRDNGNVRIVELDAVSETVTAEFVYVMRDTTAAGTAKTDKIGDAVALGGGRFLVAERDDRTGADSNKLIYEINLRGATNVNTLPATLATPAAVAGQTIEQLNAEELRLASIRPVDKRLVVNAAAVGYTGVSKLEGLAVVDGDTVAVINDNDFGVLAAPIAGDGNVALNPNPEPIRLGLIDFTGSNGLDSNDRDVNGTSGGGGKIAIAMHPVFGQYMPDAVAAYASGGTAYFITANEGDDRNDFLPAEETIRVGSATLDPAAFPNAATLKQNVNLGRLTIFRNDGDIDGDGDLDRLQMLGARSFSIWDAAGNLVWDAGDALEQITAQQVPALFNSDGTASSFDTRSDNKGPEPEGVAVGTIDGRTYAFVALERTGGVVAYDVTDPRSPQFVTYVNPAAGPAGAPGKDDVSPEGIIFISAAQSPTGRPLLAVGNEVSGTATIYAVDVNHPPTVADQTFSIDEKSPAGTAVGVVAATDANPRQTLAFAITGGNTDGAFGIDPATGQITVANPAAVDFDVNTSFALKVTVTDTGNPLPARSTTADVTVNVRNLNDFSVADASVVEGTGGTRFLQFTVTRDASAGVAGVEFATSPGTASSPGDFAATAGSVLFANGQTSRTVRVPVVTDSVAEANETLTITLGDPSDGFIRRGQAVGTIIDDDSQPLLRISDAAILEGNVGTRLMTFTVTLSKPAAGSVTVRYTTAGVTAVVGRDYTSRSGVLTFAPGQTSRTLTVPIIGDRTVESDETFNVLLSHATGGAKIADGTGVGTILNDDSALPRMSIGGVSSTEGRQGNKAFGFVVTLDKPATTAVSVRFGTSNGTASAGTDYIARSGMLTFAAGETRKTIWIDVRGDSKKEATETFFVGLHSPTGATISVGRATGTIINDD